jgi:hypothetical protein
MRPHPGSRDAPAGATSTLSWLACLAFLAFLSLLPASCARETAPESTGAGAPGAGAGAEQGHLEPPEQPDVPLLELSYEGGMIANPDPTPFVRVYTGGRVLVHYPAYMKKAGDYELRLSEAEIAELLAEFETSDVLTLESSEIAALTAEMRAGDEPQVTSDDHGVEAVVRIRAESFTPAGEDTPTLRSIDHELRADAEALRAAPATGFERLRELATGVERLEALAERADLRRIQP